MSSDSDTIEEKRVYADRAGKRVVLVATDVGLARLAVSGEQVGEVGLVHREAARDVACAPEAAPDDPDAAGADDAGGAPDDSNVRVALATDDDVLVGPTADALDPAGFGPAVAVGFHDGRPMAAGPEGRLARYTGVTWADLGTLDATVRALDGDLVATDGGVYRVLGDDIAPAGLADVRDVSAGGVPHAATADGLYALGNGWMERVAGDFRLMAAAPAAPGDLDRAHAATAEAAYEHADGAWTEVDLPVAPPLGGVAYDEGATYAATVDGTVLLTAGEGWRTHPLGLREVHAVAAP